MDHSFTCEVLIPSAVISGERFLIQEEKGMFWVIPMTIRDKTRHLLKTNQNFHIARISNELYEWL